MPWRHLLVLFTLTVGLAGCHTCERPRCVAERPYICNRCGDFPQPPRAVVPGRVPPGPGPAAFVPPAPEQPAPTPPASIERPVPAPPPTNSEPPPTSTELGMAPGAESTPPGVRLGPPGPIRRESASVSPEGTTKEPPLAAVPNKPEPPRVAEGRERDKDAQAAIDLPGFAEAVPGVASGIKPFPDGVTLLAEKGYKAVLHVHAPGEDTTAARKVYERKGLRYLTLEASAKGLTRDVYEKFVGHVKDAGNQPLYVFDKDGAVVGGLWYLYYRVEMKEADEKARTEAQRLGLSFDADRADHREMLLAVQKLLDAMRP